MSEIRFEFSSELTDSGNYINNLKKNLELKLSDFKNKSLFEIDLIQVANITSKEKWIKSFEIQREWPNSLKVKIKNYEIVMLYWNDKNEIYPIFENNEILEPMSKREISDRIHVYDKKIANQVALRKKTIDLIQRLPEKGPLSQKEISEVGFDNKSGFWFQLIKKDLLVKMGEEKFEIKAERVSNVLEYLESKQINARVIDANLSQKVLVRLRKDP